MSRLYKSLAIALLLIRPASARLANENLLVTPPPGYKVDFHTERNNMVMSEMVPSNETVDDWTEMVTVQIFHGMKAEPERFKTRLQQRWSAACPGASDAEVTSGIENGYPMLLWLLICPQNPGTGKPEYTWFKAIAGNDSFYLVQKAFKFEPTKDQVVHWMGYLKTVAVCDTRLPERACPQTRK
ncbi:MAG: hypothetical protein WBF58_23760 [Xanthobacteraceae bacterium]